MRIVVVVLVLLAIIAGGAWLVAGRGGGPSLAIVKPEKVVGQGGTLEVTADVPGGTLTDLQAWIEQGGKRLPVYSMAQPWSAALKQESPERVRLVQGIGKRDVPQLESGDAKIIVTATRSALYGWRMLSSTASRDFTVRLQPPRVAVVSMHHFVNHGGPEAVVYRATPADVESGVRVGDVRYRGYPLSGAGVAADPALHIAFFALLHDQDLNTPMQVYAADPAGNVASAPIDAKVFPKRFRRSRIEVPQTFLERVVPAILENTRDFKADAPDDLLRSFLQINGELRRRNAETIASFTAKSSPEILWRGAFQALGNAAIESSFADHRTYFHEGKEIDQQVHLGFDLAVTVQIPILSANRGQVLYADYLGIYGNCVIVDHGMGVQSLYAHLSSMDVQPGDQVEKGQTLGRSGMTGLAGGDHLHFTMLVGGRPVNSVEFWDPHWIEDRVLRKIREAVPTATPVATAGS